MKEGPFWKRFNYRERKDLPVMSTDESFNSKPVTDYHEIVSEEDVYDLVDEGVIGQAQEYGFSCEEEMVDFILGRNFQDQGNNPLNPFRGLFDEGQDRELVNTEIARDQLLDMNYKHAGGIWYNPENGDQWITNDEDLGEI